MPEPLFNVSSMKLKRWRLYGIIFLHLDAGLSSKSNNMRPVQLRLISGFRLKSCSSGKCRWYGWWLLWRRIWRMALWYYCRIIFKTRVRDMTPVIIVDNLAIILYLYCCKSDVYKNNWQWLPITSFRSQGNSWIFMYSRRFLHRIRQRSSKNVSRIVFFLRSGSGGKCFSV